METQDTEQTLVLIKPDALKNSLTGYVLSLLSEINTGLRFAGAKIVSVNRMLAEEHYAEHRGKGFFESLLDYLQGKIHYPANPEKRRVVAFVYVGPGAIQKIRDIVGPTNPHKARDEKPGTIRALGTIVNLSDGEGKSIGDRMDNLIHASANAEDAEREIKLWFKPVDIPPLMRAYETERCESHYYSKDGKLSTAYEKGSACLLAPGDIVWKTDLDALRALASGKPSTVTLKAVAAKYLVNDEREDD
jgi:nucleoside-diphosphate kinase